MGRIILNNEEYTGSSGSAPVTDVTVNGTSVVNAQGVAEVTAVQDNPTFTEASTRANIASGESFATILGKIKKFFTDLKAVAFSGSYNDLSDKPTIPDISTKVSKSGDTMTGELEIRRATGVDAQFRSTNTTNGYQISFGWGSGGTNRGIWDTQLNKWIFHSTGTAVYVNGVAFPTTAKLTDTTNQLSNYYSSRPASCDVQLGDGTVRYFVATSSMSTGKPTSGDAHILHLAWDNNGGWDGQLALPTDINKAMQWRNQNNGSWGSWRTIIDSQGGTITGALEVDTLTAENQIQLYATSWSKIVHLRVPTTVSAERQISLPNKDGTIALTSDISSRRYKENIIPLSEDEAKKILDVEIVNYDYKENVVDEDERYDQKGAIAEDVVNLIPNAVTYADIDGEQLPDGINYTKFIPYLIKMVQMQQKEIDQLKAEVAELKR